MVLDIKVKLQVIGGGQGKTVLYPSSTPSHHSWSAPTASATVSWNYKTDTATENGYPSRSSPSSIVERRKAISTMKDSVIPKEQDLTSHGQQGNSSNADVGLISEELEDKYRTGTYSNPLENTCLSNCYFPLLSNLCFFFPDFSKVFNSKFVHLGGDEVNTTSAQTKSPMSRFGHGLVISDSAMQKPNSRKRGLDHPDPQNKGSYNFSVTGSIDRKFEYGYLVMVNIGSETLHGVPYHVQHPPPTVAATAASSAAAVATSFDGSAATNNGIPTRARRRRKRGWRHRDPAHPKPNRSAYNFFFAEKHSKLKSLYPKQC